MSDFGVGVKTSLMISAAGSTGAAATGAAGGNTELAWAGVIVGAFTAFIAFVFHIYGAYERHLDRKAEDRRRTEALEDEIRELKLRLELDKIRKEKQND